MTLVSRFESGVKCVQQRLAGGAVTGVLVGADASPERGLAGFGLPWRRRLFLGGGGRCCEGRRFIGRWRRQLFGCCAAGEDDGNDGDKYGMFHWKPQNLCFTWMVFPSPIRTSLMKGGAPVLRTSIRTCRRGLQGGCRWRGDAFALPVDEYLAPGRDG